MSQIISQIFSVIGLYMLLMLVVYIYKFFNTTENVKAFYRKKLIMNSISFVVLVVIWIVLNLLSQQPSRPSYSPPVVGGAVPMAASGATVQSGSLLLPVMPRIFNDTSSAISDTREFDKKSFNASLKTREVEDVAKKVELLVKGMDGRIDSSNISDKYASVGFVIPKSKLDDFEKQLRTYTNKKFYSQTVSSQNLLSEKKGIEQNQDTTKKTIAELTAKYEKAKAEYEKLVGIIKEENNSVESQIRSYDVAILRDRSTLEATTNDAARLEIEADIARLQGLRQNEIEGLRERKATLSSITRSLEELPASSIGISLNEAKNVLADLSKTEGVFLEKVETVQGYVNVNFVSVWEIIDIYSPINPIIFLLGIVFVTRMYLLRKSEQRLINQ